MFRAVRRSSSGAPTVFAATYRSKHVELLMNKWNDKFRYQVASCWLFILSNTTMHRSMNIKFKKITHVHLKFCSFLKDFFQIKEFWFLFHRLFLQIQKEDINTFQINQPTRCNNFSSLLLDVIYSSTCFGRPHARPQELNNCSSSLWFYRWSVVVTVLLVVVGLAQTRPTALLSPRSKG